MVRRRKKRKNKHLQNTQATKSKTWAQTDDFFDPRIKALSESPNLPLKYCPPSRRVLIALVISYFCIGFTPILLHAWSTKNHVTIHQSLRIRAVDSYGHPVAGALIDLNQSRQGITNSYGYWEAETSVHHGETLKITAHKKLSQQVSLEAKRTLKIKEKKNNKPLQLTLRLEGRYSKPQ